MLLKKLGAGCVAKHGLRSFFATIDNRKGVNRRRKYSLFCSPNLAVFHVNCAVCDGCKPFIVGHNDESLSEFIA